MAKDNPQNPYTQDETATRADLPLPLQRATVIDADDDGLHRVTVEIFGTNTAESATVLVPMYGTVWVPEEGTDVMVLYGADDTPYIIGAWYAEDRVDGGYVDVPEYNVGDIIIGNDNGYIAVREDGTVETTDTFSSYSDENAQDAVGSVLSSDFTYDDAGNSITIDPHVNDTDAHHTRYSDSEVLSVINNDTDHGSTASHNYFSGNHADLTNITADAHHTRYSDSEVLSVINNNANDVNIGVEDTRDTNESPSFFDKEISYDFKRTSAIGVPASGTYCGVMTFAPWSDNSGDKSHQIAYTNDGLFLRSAFPDSSSWGPWTKVGDEDKVFLAEGSTTNINQSTAVSWSSTTFNDNAYSWNGSSQLTIDKAGRYEIHAEADFTSSGRSRQNPNLFIHQNNNIVGVGGRSGYMRDREDHNHSSVHSHAVISANSGDVIHVESRAEADAGSVTPDRAMFYVKRIQQGDTDTPTLGYFDGNLTTTQADAENGIYVNVAESVNQNDGWTVNSSSQISPNESGTYKVSFNVNFHRTGSGARNIMYGELELNGTRLTDRTRGVCYIRNAGAGDEGDSDGSTILDLNAGDNLRVFAGEERGAETGNDIERANITIEKI